jgi:hypothetical protein
MARCSDGPPNCYILQALLGLQNLVGCLIMGFFSANTFMVVVLGKALFRCN